MRTGESFMCSIVIPVHNRASLTRQCLDRLLTGPPERTEFEVIVVDDASSDDTADVLAARETLIRVVAHQRNAGFAKSCNAGAGVARGRYLVFLNNDTLPEPGWLDALVDHAAGAPNAAIVGSKLLYPNDTVQHVGIVVTQEKIPRHIYAGFPADHPAVCKSRPFQMVTAACVLVRREAFEAVGGFDETFVNGYEDIDLCLRVREQGGEVHVCSDSVLYHLEKATRDESGYARNHEFFLRRWGPRLEPDDLRYYLEDGLMRLGYREHYPLRLEVSPLLAEVDEEGREPEADRLLAARARQVFELLQENVQLALGPLDGRSEPAEAGALSERAAVLFLSGAPGDTKRYRCDHQAEELQLLGATADVAMADEVALGDVIDRYGCFVLHRVPWSEHIEWFLSQLAQRGKTAIFDTDDLVFDPSVAHHVAALQDMDPAERMLFQEGLVRYRRTMLACDAVVVTTESLRALAAEIHPRVLVAPNAVSKEMVELAEASLGRRRGAARGESKQLTITYMSGTHTHNRDFLEAAEAVLDVLADNPNATFLAVGHLKLDERFDTFASQVEQLPLQPWQNLPEFLAEADVNLAPLEPQNAFTESKSCLKYIEAGLLAIPTIASPRTDFRRAIRHGDNGLLAEKPTEWRDALVELADSPERRRVIGEMAYADVRRRHTTKAVANGYYATIAELSRDKHRAAPLAVDWVLRAPIAQTGGGYRNIFRIADRLGRMGHRVRFHIEQNDHLSGLSEEQVRDFVQEHFGPLDADLLAGHDGVGPADVAIATNWPTADVVARARNVLFKHYFIQDFESDFYGPDDERADDARATYDLPLRHVCLGRDLAARLSDLTGKPAEFVDFALDEPFQLIVPPEERPGPIRVLFFARPGMRRRGFEFGMDALALVKESNPDVRVELFGASAAELGPVPFEHENLGVLGPERLAEAMNAAHVAVSLSLTNISNVPFEGMACGCAVVEADVPTTRAMVASGENCLLAEPKAEALALTIGRVVEDPELRVRLASRGAQDMEGRTWDQTARQFERVLLDACFARLDRSRLTALLPEDVAVR